MSTTTTTFDVGAFVRSIEGRDAATHSRLYADDAVITTIDQEHPPSAPSVVQGREEIDAAFADILGREMQHEVPDIVVSGDSLAYRIDCRYPDGTRVACHAIARLRDGRIVSEHGVQAWDH